jgi:ABC-type transporter Mla subunit MlaD
MTPDMIYAADLAETLEQLLSQLSIEPGNKSDALRNAITNANNVLDEYQIATDEHEATLKTEMAE